MSAINLKFSGVSFSYYLSSGPVISSLNIHFSKGWTGIVGPNGAGKTTVAKLAAGILKPTSGDITVVDGLSAFYCEQETGFLPSQAHDFVLSPESAAGRICSKLGIDSDWPDRWDTLSRGERKRLQVGIALWNNPDVLVLDEPLNHIDLNTGRIITGALLDYSGIGIIVSHDRELLNRLCNSCLFMRPGYAVMRHGNFDKGLAQQDEDDNTRERNYSIALKNYRESAGRASALKRSEAGRASKLSKRNIPRHDHDARGKVDAARLTGKDKTGMRKVKILERRVEKLGTAAESVYFKKRQISGIIFRGERSKRDFIVEINEHVVALGPVKKLFVPDIVISPSDRIAITGDNGSGKSTFIRSLIPLIGISPERVVYIPQEIDEDLWKTVRECMDSIDDSELGMMLTAVHRLGSEPERVIASESPSPGEKRKIMLAMGLLRRPSLIIMDEPTNHMDMPSIRCIEEALNSFTGALLIVSHDPVFIKNTTDTVWEIIHRDPETGMLVKTG